MSSTYAQKVSIAKWVNHTVDSLQKINVDTIEYYHQYCGECEIIEKPPMLEKPPGLSEHSCQTDYSSWDERATIIIYRQQGKYYSLAFNCSYPPIKKDLGTVKSLSYFISIIPVLNKRDKALKAMEKNKRYPSPVIVDGRYDDAYIYLKNIRQRVFLHDDETKNRRVYFWIDKELKLIDLISSDLSLKN